jgi:ubiquinone/menaquinone biosynthesis C-methylase UbiE
MDDWRSYDAVAETYERVHAPRFAEPARGLVELVGLLPGERVLDVGTGTGVVAQAATDALQGQGSVVGADPSEGMLAVARKVRPDLTVIGAEAIDLPFPDGTFDVVLGGFVLAHFTKYDTALFDLSRVLKIGGRLGLTAWADGPDALQQAWMEHVTQVVPEPMLASAYSDAAPWHKRFRDRAAIEEALIDAGFRHVRTETVRYRWTYTQEEYLDGLEVWATGRFVRGMLGDRGWEPFRERVRADFRERFPDPLNDFRDVTLAVATKIP